MTWAPPDPADLIATSPLSLAPWELSSEITPRLPGGSVTGRVRAALDRLAWRDATPTLGGPSATPIADATPVDGGTPSTGVSRRARRERDACRGVGRAPIRTATGEQLCAWCDEPVAVVDGRSSAHRRRQLVINVASINIGGPRS
jgi:hypothetical protein